MGKGESVAIPPLRPRGYEEKNPDSDYAPSALYTLALLRFVWRIISGTVTPTAAWT